MVKMKFSTRDSNPTSLIDPSPIDPSPLLPSPERNSVGFLYNGRDSSIVDPASSANSSRPHNLLTALRMATGRRKPLAVTLSEAAHENRASQASENAASKLSFIDLLAIGIGGTIGSGVFVLTGDVQPVAGPSAVLSWLIAGGCCLLSGLSYMELSSRIPTRGSTYIFAYTTLGELAAVVGGVCLTMEYGISGAGVARSWSDKAAALLRHSLDTPLGDTVELDWAAMGLQVLCVSVCLMKLGK